MALESSVIFRINSALGPGGMASLQSGIQMVGAISRKVIGAAKELEKFGQVFSRLQVDISEADQATKGLIDTMGLMQAANKINQAGLDVTASQFKDIAVVATEYAKSVGISATDAMKRLTDSISKGSSRALKEVGIDLEETEDLLLAQAEAIAKVTERAKGITIEIDTMGEALFAANNNWETFLGLLFEGSNKIPLIGGVLANFNDTLSDINAQLAEAPKAYTEYATSVDRWAESIRSAAFDVIEFIQGPLVELEKALRGTDESFLESSIQQFKAGEQRRSDEELEIFALKRRIEIEERAQERQERKNAKRAQSGARATGGTGRGRGGGKGGGGPVMEFEESEAVDLFDIGREDQEAFVELPTLGSPEQTEAAEAFRRQDADAVRALTDAKIEAFENEEQERESRRMWFEELSEQRESEIGFAEEWGSVWEGQLKRVSAGSLAAKGSMDILHAGVNASVRAAIAGQGSFAEALRSAVEETATNVAVEAGFMALLELAKAVGSAASFNYPAAAAHAAAAALYIATAAAAGVVAGVAHSAAPSSAGAAATGAGPGSGYNGGGAEFAGSPGSKERQEVTVNIQMREGADGFFEAVIDEDDRRAQDGRRTLGQAA